MKYAKLNQDKGVAGLNILLSVISMLFVIGIILMVFTIAGTKLRDAVDDNASKAIINATYTSLGETVDWYPTFIVLAAMVVLILLLAVIINSIRGSGLMGEGGA